MLDLLAATALAQIIARCVFPRELELQRLNLVKPLEVSTLDYDPPAILFAPKYINRVLMFGEEAKVFGKERIINERSPNIADSTTLKSAQGIG